MSRYFGLGYAGQESATTSGRDAADAYRKSTALQTSGTSWTGGRRTGMASLMDKAELNRQMLDHQGKFTSTDATGVYNLAVVKDDGSAVETPQTINIGGRYFQSAPNGRLRICDSEYLNAEVEAFKDLRNYEEKVVQAMLVSIEVCTLLIGRSVKEVEGLLKKGGGKADTKGSDILVQGLEGSGIDTDANPNSLRYLSPDSSEYAKGIAKLRMIVNKMGIIVNEESQSLHSPGLGVKETKNSGADTATA